MGRPSRVKPRPEDRRSPAVPGAGAATGRDAQGSPATSELPPSDVTVCGRTEAKRTAPGCSSVQEAAA